MIHILPASLIRAPKSEPGKDVRGLGRAGVRAIVAACLCGVILGGISARAKAADLYQLLTADNGLTLFKNAVDQAGLSELLMGTGPFIFLFLRTRP